MEGTIDVGPVRATASSGDGDLDDGDLDDEGLDEEDGEAALALEGEDDE